MVRDRKVIGEVKRVFADLTFSPEGIKWTSDSGDSEEGGLETKHRLVNLDLAGGALLDSKPSLSLSPPLCPPFCRTLLMCLCSTF